MPWNSRAFHAAEQAGAGAIGSARSISRLYGCLARGGEIDGLRLLAPETVELGVRELSRGYEPLLEMPMAFGCGFHLQTDAQPFGPPGDGFGHNGAGGSMHGAWPGLGVGYSYAMNRMRNDEQIDPRGHALLAALHRCVT